MRRKSKRGKRSGLAGVFDAYAAPGTGNAGNTAMKTLIDVGVGVPVGVLIGGAAGLWSLPLGLLLIGGGHHLKDQSGISSLVRIAGASAIAYGVAKNIDFKAASKQAQVNGVGGLAGATQGMKDRLQTVKADLMAAYFLDRIFKKNNTGGTTSKMVDIDDDDDSVGAIDVSALDFFDDYNQQEADEFEEQQSYSYPQPDQLPYYGSTSSVSPETSFALFEDEPDMSDI